MTQWHFRDAVFVTGVDVGLEEAGTTVVGRGFELKCTGMIQRVNTPFAATGGCASLTPLQKCTNILMVRVPRAQCCEQNVFT